MLVLYKKIFNQKLNLLNTTESKLAWYKNLSKKIFKISSMVKKYKKKKKKILENF